MTDTDLDAIRARADAATPGPWYPGKQWEGSQAVQTTVLNRHAVAICGDEIPDDKWPASADAEFIAHARQDVPTLIDEVTWMRERIAQFIEREANIKRRHAAELDTCRAKAAAYDKAVDRIRKAAAETARFAETSIKDGEIWQAVANDLNKLLGEIETSS